MADRYQSQWAQGDQDSASRRDDDAWQSPREEGGPHGSAARSAWDSGQSGGYRSQEPGRWHGRGSYGSQGGTQSGGQSGSYSAPGAFGSEHRGYAHAHTPEGGSYGGGRDMQGGSYGGGYGAQRGGGFQSQGGSGAQSRDRSNERWHAQGSTGYGTHGYGGQASGYSLQSGGYGSSEGYGSQGGYGPQGGEAFQGYGSQGGGTYASPGSYGAQNTHQAGFGGYGSHAGGYGSQSSYGSHGGYGSQAHTTQRGFGPHGGYGGAQGGYGAQGGAQGGWWPDGSRQTRTPRRGPKGYTRSDERIREDICEHLMASHHIDSSDVTVEVSGGKVTLEGTVPERRMKHAIEDMAGACPGVNDVDNLVRVAPHGADAETEASGSAGASGSSSRSTGEEGSTSSPSRGPGSSRGLGGQSTSSSSTTKPVRE